MKESIYKSYDELPLFLNAELVAKTLGVSISSAYEDARRSISVCAHRQSVRGAQG